MNDNGREHEAALDAALRSLARGQAPAGFVQRTQAALENVPHRRIGMVPWKTPVAAVLVAGIAVGSWFAASHRVVQDADPHTVPLVARQRPDVGITVAPIMTTSPQATKALPRPSRATFLPAETPERDLPALAVPAAVEQAAIEPAALVLDNLDIAPAAPISPLPGRAADGDGPGGDR